MKKEEKSSIKAIQLTGRDSSALWKTKDDGFIMMSDMDDLYLQKALGVVQQRQVRNFNMLELDFNLEKQLKSEGENRGIVLKDLNEVSDNWHSRRFVELGDKLKRLSAYLKKLSSEKKKEIV